MKVLVAGATGAIGQPLSRQLAEKGHAVIALGRRPSPTSNGNGITNVQCDVLDKANVEKIMAQHRPDAVVSQLTSLPKEFRPRTLNEAYERNNRVRYTGTQHLLAAAEANGASVFVAQSSGFWYAPTPGNVKTETDPFWTEAPEPIGEAVRTMVRTEELVVAARGPRPIVLRYAGFYGPGTWFARNGTVGTLTRKRQYPLIQDGNAFMSFLHVEDAAAATVRALEKPVAGVYNVADDEPAPAHTWLPAYARALGAKPPRKIPFWLARLAIGKPLATYTTNTRGADNRRFKETFAWTPRYPSWRAGFKDGLG